MRNQYMYDTMYEISETFSLVWNISYYIVEFFHPPYLVILIVGIIFIETFFLESTYKKHMSEHANDKIDHISGEHKGKVATSLLF